MFIMLNNLKKPFYVIKRHVLLVIMEKKKVPHYLIDRIIVIITENEDDLIDFLNKLLSFLLDTNHS